MPECFKYLRHMVFRAICILVVLIRSIGLVFIGSFVIYKTGSEQFSDLDGFIDHRELLTFNQTN